MCVVVSRPSVLAWCKVNILLNVQQQQHYSGGAANLCATAVLLLKVLLVFPHDVYGAGCSLLMPGRHLLLLLAYCPAWPTARIAIIVCACVSALVVVVLSAVYTKRAIDRRLSHVHVHEESQVRVQACGQHASGQAQHRSLLAGFEGFESGWCAMGSRIWVLTPASGYKSWQL